MKKSNLIFFFIFFVNFFSNAQKQTLFVDKDYQSILNQSKKENKPIALMFYASWCVHCNKMKNEVFTDKKVIKFYNSNFLCVAVNVESNEGVDLKKHFENKFKVKSFPTFSFLDGEENILNCISGELKVDDFITEGKNALLPENHFNNLFSLFNKDTSNAYNCIKYIIAIRKAGLDATEITKRYLKTMPEKEWFTENTWKIMSNGINKIDTYEINFINIHKEEFSKVASPTRVEKKLIYVANENLKPLIDLNDTINYYKLKPFAESFKIRKVDSLLFKFDLQLYGTNKNWKLYKSTAKNSVEKFAWKDSNTLVDICSVYLESIKDRTALAEAINWSKQALNLGESLDKYILISKLYLKVNDKKNALEYAQFGKESALKFGWKTNEIDTLLLKIKKT